MRIGVVKEIMHGEGRVAATPETVGMYIRDGFSVLVERGAGEWMVAWPLAEDDIAAINAWFQTQSEEKLLGEVLDESRQSYARLAEVVQRLPDAALSDGAYFAPLNFAQSDRKLSRPRSVSGCFTRFLRTENGTVAMSAPMSAACVT